MSGSLVEHRSSSQAGQSPPSLIGEAPVPSRAEQILAQAESAAALPRNPLGPPADRAQPLLQGVSTADVDRIRQLYDLRRGAVVVAAVPPPQDPTEDPIEHTVISAEMGVGLADLGLGGIQTAVGKLTAAGQGIELGGNLIGMLPEILTLVASRRLIAQGQTEQAAEQALGGKIATARQVLGKILGLDGDPEFSQLRDRLAALALDPAAAGADPLTDTEVRSVGQTIDLLERLSKGQEVSQAFLDESLRELRGGLALTKLSLGGAIVETGGAAMTTAAEIGGHAVPELIGAIGYGAGAVGSAITLPFTAKFAYDNARAIAPHVTATREADKLLQQTADEKDRSLAPVSRPSLLRRALAKLAQRRAEPGGKRFKTAIFGLAIAAGLTNIGAGTAAALGAGVAASLAGAATGIGLVALVGFFVYAGYKVYQSRKANGDYRPGDLKKVITGQPNPVSGPLKTRQAEKLLNRAMIASCEQALHQKVDDFFAKPLNERPNFKIDVIEGLRSHARGILRNEASIAGQTEHALSEAMADRVVDACLKKVTIDANGRLTAVMGREPAQQFSLPDGARAYLSGVGQGAPLQTPLRDALKQVFTEALASELRAANRARVSLVPNRTAFSAALNRVDDGFGFPSSSHRVTQANRAAVAAALAGQLPDAAPVNDWAGAPAGANAEPLSLHNLVDAQADELARAAALRKLMRRDPEALLLTYVQTMRDEYLSGKADNDKPLAQLRSDLETFGVKAETLSTIKSAYDDNQIRHAVGLISRELSFLS